MDHHAARSRRALVGIAAMALGSAGLVGGFAQAAAAHEGTEPDKVHDNLACADIAEMHQVQGAWTEYKIEPFPASNGEHDYVLSDRGTPEDDSDDAVFTLEVFAPKRFHWTSNVGIDAVFVKGGNAEDLGSYLYWFDGDERTADDDYTVPPWGEWHKNAISHVTVCWDDEHPPPTSSSTTSSTSTTVIEEPATTSSSTTSSTVAPTTSSSVAPPTTEAPPTSEATTTTVSSGGGLPVTGSSSGLLAAVGGGLLLAGGIFLVAKQQLWRRSA